VPLLLAIGAVVAMEPTKTSFTVQPIGHVHWVKEHVVEVDKTDAFDGTPILDIKPYLPNHDSASDTRVLEWATRK
jgi:tRNA (Thr-GGU) A37 N-methylase